MFETSVVESRRAVTRKKIRFVLLPLSIGGHLILVGGMVFAGVWKVTMPTNSPAQQAVFFSSLPLPELPEPAAGGVGRPDPPAPRPAEPVQQVDPSQVAPSEIPDEIPVVDSGSQEPAGTGPVGDGPFVVGEGGDGDGEGAGPGTGEGPGGSGIGDSPLPVGNGVLTPVVTKRVDPVYPPSLIRARLRGEARVECIVSRTGEVESVRLVSATHPLFGESAIVAVRQWKFRAGSLRGNPVPTIFELRVTFQTR